MHSSAKRKINIIGFPTILIVHVQRFNEDLTKNTAKVYPMQIKTNLGVSGDKIVY